MSKHLILNLTVILETFSYMMKAYSWRNFNQHAKEPHTSNKRKKNGRIRHVPCLGGLLLFNYCQAPQSRSIPGPLLVNSWSILSHSNNHPPNHQRSKHFWFTITYKGKNTHSLQTDPPSFEQALQNSCELLRQRKELHTSSWNCMQVHETACKLMKLRASSWNFM